MKKTRTNSSKWSAKRPKAKRRTVYFRIATDAIGPDGLPIGKEEAERLARREVRRMARRVEEPTIRSTTMPRIQLYTAAINGTIECRDAETGSPIWMSQVGNPRLNFGKMGIDDDFVTITNGGNLVKLDVTNGEPINTVRTTSMPLYGAINAGDYSLVPTIRNGVEGYPLRDITRVPFMEIVVGLALDPPSKSPTSSKIAWGTDRGFVYVMELSGEPSVIFRLNTDGIVSGRIASADGDRFFFGSESGQVYGLRATRTGRVLWSRPYGEPFYKSPFLVDDAMYLPSAFGNLHAIDQKTGLPLWEAPTANVDEIIGGFGDKLFVRLLSQNFAAVDLKTGELLQIDNGLKAGQTARQSHNRTACTWSIRSAPFSACGRSARSIRPCVDRQTFPMAMRRKQPRNRNRRVRQPRRPIRSAVPLIRLAPAPAAPILSGQAMLPQETRLRPIRLVPPETPPRRIRLARPQPVQMTPSAATRSAIDRRSYNR